ncbi:MAG: CrcB family protein [Bdellovibrionaceae bacterium]|nr:CrcB family protein [Pseudobdellovibrionaceae bacterium]
MKMELLIVGTFGFVAAIMRFLVYVWLGDRSTSSFPWATFTVNTVGCFLIGILGTLVEKQIPNYRLLYLAGSVGFLGTFTTFSAFGFETLHLLRNQEIGLAVANIAANIIIGLSAVFLGRWLTLLY